VKALRIERSGPKESFRFALEGDIDAAGARALDRLLFECQARGAREVHLDVSNVRAVSTLGTSVFARQGRVYEGTERRIYVTGLRPELRTALAGVDAIVYESNEPVAAPEEVPASHEAAASSDEAPPAELPAAPEAPAPASLAEPSGLALASLQTKLKRKIVEFRNLFEITRALNLALDLDEVLHLFSLSVMGQFGVERLAVFLSEPRENGALVARQVRGFAHDHFAQFSVPAEPFMHAAGENAFFALSDVREPDGSGEQVEALRQSGLEWGVALWVRRDLEGVLLLGGRGGRRGFHEDERDLVTTLAHQGAVAIANARFHRAQEDRNLGLVRGMMSLLESRDPYVRGHTERVVRYVTATAKLLHYPKASLKGLIYGTVLRDIGMISVSHLILKNPAQLTDDEWALVRQHPARGAQILEEMEFPKEVIDVVMHHHERWGGEGYPSGIRGNEIPLGARIVALVDSYVAMTAERPYRRALPYEKARQVIAENWGSPFDPAVIDGFLQVLDKAERRTRQRLGASSPNVKEPEARPGTDGASSGDTIPMESSS
jgi:anti-anti-sigma regulatory factor